MKNKDVNPEVDASPLDIARVYASSVPVLAFHPTIVSILDHFGQGRIQAGLQALDDLSVEFDRQYDRSSFQHFRQFSAFLKKIPWETKEFDRRRNAIKAFLDSELRCAETNKFFRMEGQAQLSQDLWLTLWRAKMYVRKVLGRLTPNRYQRILRLSRPGGGVSIGTWNRLRTSPIYKYMATDPVVTPLAKPVAIDLLRHHSVWLKQFVEPGTWEDGAFKIQPQWVVTRSNRVSFVPKDAKTFRSIAVEPSVNIMLQLGVHEYFRDILWSQASTDIGDQSINQILAYLGSRGSFGGEGLATLDLKSASDSICVELVRFLLPDDWFTLLDALRCHYFTLDGVEYVSEKFSSMGNGFTFALETLIFKALCEGALSVCGGGVSSVYGDDIIISTRAALLLTEALNVCGLVVNNNKSFYFGPFRESCGTDWYEGVNVTPLYLRDRVLRLTDSHRVLNTWGSRPSGSKVRKFLLDRMKLSGEPLIFGLENEDPSTCIFTSFAYAKGGKLLRWDPHVQNWRFRGVVERPLPDTSAPVEWNYLQALLTGEKGRCFLRGTGIFKTTWLTPGRTISAWWGANATDRDGTLEAATSEAVLTPGLDPSLLS